MTDGGNGKSENKIMEVKKENFDKSAKKFIECCICGKKGHTSTECYKNSNKRWCSN